MDADVKPEPGEVIIPHDDKPSQSAQFSGGNPSPVLPATPTVMPQPSAAPEAQAVPSSTPSEPPAVPAPISPSLPDPLPPLNQPVSGPDGTSGMSADGYDPNNAVDWQYGDDGMYDSGMLDDLNWTTPESTENTKSLQWYGLLGLAALAIAGVDYFFLMRDILSVIIIIFAVSIFAVYAGRKPNIVQYHLSPEGLQVGNRLYDLQGYRAFSVDEEGGHVSINFAPLARFAPPLTIYVAPDLEGQVLDYLSNFLPFEEHKADAVDNLMRRIRF